ncbi:MAG: class I SAM-dependent methyltransferase [Candidatus Sumerlaeia bacterium]
MKPSAQAAATGRAARPARPACPVCAGEGSAFMSLAAMPVLIGRQFETPEAARASARGPVRLAFCPHCSFIWNEAFDPALLVYDTAYDNSLHYSDVFQEYTRRLVERLVESYGIRDKTVVDIGCGKGDFLGMLCEAGGNRGVGFDPSYEGELDPAGRPVTFVRDMFSQKYGCVGGDLVCSRYVLEHVPEPARFVSMIRAAIGGRRDAVVYAEVPNVEFILRGLSVWDIIYEHCSYFSAASLARIFCDRGFRIARLAEGYAGQFLCIDALAGGNEEGRPLRRHELAAIASQVRAFGAEFERRVGGWRERLAQWGAEGRRVVAWGAGAKAVGFLNMVGAGDEIGGVVDINPNKRGHYLAGTGHRILAPDELAQDRPATVIVMNPVYRDEIRDRLHAMNLNPELMEA